MCVQLKSFECLKFLVWKYDQNHSGENRGERGRWVSYDELVSSSAMTFLIHHCHQQCHHDHDCRHHHHHHHHYHHHHRHHQFHFTIILIIISCCMQVPPPRFQQMRTDQDWTNVWPAAHTFKWSAVPFPVRQGRIEVRHLSVFVVVCPTHLLIKPLWINDSLQFKSVCVCTYVCVCVFF
jgi:hypothetical protein